MRSTAQGGFELAPDPRAAARREVAGVLGQPGGAQLALRSARVVIAREAARTAAVEVEHERASQRLPLARLTDAPGVEEPALALECQLAVWRGRGVGRHRLRDVRVSEDQHARAGMALGEQVELLARGRGI